ncbi:type II secretion system F family protein [Allorhizocola rhizosphaerae]|uniref:type II secretion system F family protein n=1 Tax=Allorhizocola rhizosphaerae TaxID=1872709 RepID=UPI000E3B7EB7|nr:type II secretion system F family protein [Allorhizocola rhizosphaerae]
MIPQVWVAIAVAAGAVAGYGLYLLVVQFIPATPALGPALKRLHPTPEPIVVAEPKPVPVRASSADFEILGRSREKHMFHVILGGVVSLLIPPMVSLLLVIFGMSLPWSIPLLATLAAGVGGAALVHFDLKARAKAARAEFVRALCTYTALTAHQVHSGHGAVEAMERAAAVCTGWPYARLRMALLTAQLQMAPPWDELKRLSTAIGVVELTTFADIMQSAGTDGAQVYSTLRAQAASLRDQVRAKALESAKTRTSKLDVPSTMLIIIFLVLVGYPLMMNVFFTGK